MVKVSSSKCTVVVEGKYHMYMYMQRFIKTCSLLMYINFTKTQQNAEKILKNFLFLSAFCSFYGTILVNLAEPFLENLQKS